MECKHNIPKIVTVLGARPQFIKAAVVSPVISNFANECIIHTGQHFDSAMSDIFFDELSLPKPNYALDIHSLSHGDMTGRMLMEIEKILLLEQPNLVLIYGDTNSTLAGALAAAKLNIPIAHVEAGVRSYNRKMPEEINRIVADQLTSLYFVTSKDASTNLQREGCNIAQIYVVGDVMYDLALKMSSRLDSQCQENEEIEVNLENLEVHGSQEIKGSQKKSTKLNDYILVTLHRSENTNSAQQLEIMRDFIEGLSKIKPIVWVLHPRTEKAFNTFHLSLPVSERIQILKPLGYKDMLRLVKHAFAIATDSGGLQKEAFYYKKPCITMRNETEWSELSDIGWNQITGTENVDSMLKKTDIFLQKDFKAMPYQEVYGNGTAAKKIGEILQRVLT